MYRWLGGIRQNKKHIIVDEREITEEASQYREPAVSMEIYDEPLHDESGEITGFNRVVGSDLVFDFDNELDVEQALDDVRILYNQLVRSLRFNPEEIEIYFSGRKGFNLFIHYPVIRDAFHSIKDIEDFALRLKRSLYLNSMDCKIYRTNGLIRLPNFINIPKTQSYPRYYKIGLSAEEFLTLTVKDIRVLASRPRTLIHGRTSFNPLAAGKIREMLAAAAGDIQEPNRLTRKPKGNKERPKAKIDWENDPLYKYLKEKIPDTRLQQDKWLTFSCPLNLHGGPDDHYSAGIDLESGIFSCFNCGSRPLRSFAQQQGWEDVPFENPDEIIPSGVLTALMQHDLEDLGYTPFVPVVGTCADMTVVDQVVDDLSVIINDNTGVADDIKEGLIKNVEMIGMSLDRTDDKLLIIPAHPGNYKTTVLKHYLARKALAAGEYGGIVVLERQRSIVEFVQDINRLAGKLVAYSFIGYSPQDCKAVCFPGCKERQCTGCRDKEGFPAYDPIQCRDCEVYDCRVKTNYQESRHYPIVVITHQRFAQFGVDAIDKFMSNDRILPRTDLIIDEAPPLVQLHETTINELVMFQNSCNRNSFLIPEGIWAGIEKLIVSLEGRIDPIKRDFQFSASFVKRYLSIYPNQRKMLKTIEAIIANGGLRVIGGKTVKLVARSILGLDHRRYKLTILDGTSLWNPQYKMLQAECRFLKLPWKPTYENVTLIVCDQKSLSKTNLSDREKLIDVLPIVSHIIMRNKEPKYLITFKDQEQAVKEYLGKKAAQGNVIIKHFNATRGSNEMRRCSTIIVLGNLRKTDQYYLSMAQSITGNTHGRQGLYLSQRDKVKRFQDRETEYFRLLDSVQELIQEIHRTIIRQWTKQPVEVYLFIRDQKLIELLKHSLPGCVVREVNLFDKKLEQFLSIMNSFLRSKRKRISKSDISSKLGVKDRHVLPAVLSNDVVIRYLADRMITVSRSYLEKTVRHDSCKLGRGAESADSPLLLGETRTSRANINCEQWMENPIKNGEKQ